MKLPLPIEEFNKLLDKYIADECTESEKALFDQWFQKLIDHNIVFSQPDATQEERMWNEVLKKSEILYLKRNTGTEQKTAWHKSKFSKIAAAIALLISVGALFYLFRGNPNSTPAEYAAEGLIETDIKGSCAAENVSPTLNKKVSLPDGTEATLYPKSKIQFKKPFAAQRPFQVYANGLVTKVLGTSFRIKSMPDANETIVDVKTGLVAIFREGKTLSDKVYHLSPNQKLVFDKNANSIELKLQESPQVLLPKEEIDKMKFDEAPAAEIFKALEKAYNLEIAYDSVAIKNCRLTMQLSMDDFYDRLKIVCKILNAEYETVDTTVYIKTKGCQ